MTLASSGARMERPPTRFARSGDAMIAYQVLGEGGVDLAVVGGPASHLDLQWEDPSTARSFERTASLFRMVRFDRRGTGLSDPVETAPTLEQQMDDLRAVLDAVGSERVALLGAVEAGLCAMYAATYPEQVSALVLVNVTPAGGLVLTEDRRSTLLDIIEHHWGEGRLMSLFAPSRVGDRRFEEWWARFERAAASPAMARMIIDLNLQTDLRAVLPTVRVPTLVLHLSDNPLVPVELGRETAALIPGARFLEFPGADLYQWPDADSPATDEIEEFLTGRRRPREPERVLATVLFTDIVGSTERAAQAGDHAWRELLDRHNQLVREELEHWRGREVKTLGDGFVATFDGPARAVRCAQAIVEGLGELGIEVRAGLHTGECELLDGDVTGIAIHIGARIGAMALGGEVLVSSTVKDLVAGAGIAFQDRGMHQLKGIPGEWHLYAVAH
jgi:class 3 adenylate cyclase